MMSFRVSMGEAVRAAELHDWACRGGVVVAAETAEADLPTKIRGWGMDPERFVAGRMHIVIGASDVVLLTPSDMWK